ncbi:hypothetical protein BDV96DRAFT_568183 [Lophiotrema nucula]|uniref:NAD(P)-binding domain-containing protein n=1 Tax=Lophiotrema nucula TaxID=690887 RepID=A0A6A5ZJK9_9PLEO|nr:hypothetical protein BDV96DRAFT_568183 [Lophiotrema nucula]
MKLLITGATGTIGGAVLRASIRNPSITSIVALSRRPLTSSLSSPKLTTVIVKDWKNWETNILDNIADADAAVWALGTSDTNQDTNMVYPMAFHNAVLEARKKKGTRKRFRFVFISGAFVSPDQGASLWFMSGARKLRGLLETRVLEFAAQNKDWWQTFAVRPGGVFKSGTWMGNCILWAFGQKLAIDEDVLGAYVADLVVNGGEEEGIVYNARLNERGIVLLKEHGE